MITPLCERLQSDRADCHVVTLGRQLSSALVLPSSSGRGDSQSITVVRIDTSTDATGPVPSLSAKGSYLEAQHRLICTAQAATEVMIRRGLQNTKHKKSSLLWIIAGWYKNNEKYEYK